LIAGVDQFIWHLVAWANPQGRILHMNTSASLESELERHTDVERRALEPAGSVDSAGWRGRDGWRLCCPLQLEGVGNKDHMDINFLDA
jgi:hypothetical protein